ncbi:hypothetical protein HIR71_13140 [Cellulomonas fimi]|uniref:Uncharacterized protein n=1 Tax=Cellulomonas fimi TaxID=1708 RepID=A0A7Y0M155_CELFI|nr:hypothetical protein [Cellulomonas fimi]
MRAEKAEQGIGEQRLAWTLTAGEGGIRTNEPSAGRWDSRLWIAHLVRDSADAPRAGVPPNFLSPN